MIREPKARWLICGSRDFHGRLLLTAALDAMVEKYGAPDCIITGGAKGADELAERWAEDRLIDTMVFPADWETHGRAAGPIRNQQMLDDGQPTLVVAFPGGIGTADMVRRVEAASIPLIQIIDADTSP